jgi:hypothetical protein
MSLTNGHDFYASLAQTGVQKFMDALFTARPHYFSFASVGMGGSSPDVTTVSPIPVPGDVSSIDYSLLLTEPSIFFFPNQFAVPSPNQLQVRQGQFGIYLEVTTSFLKSSIPPSTVSGTIKIWCVGKPTVRGVGSTATTVFSLSDVQVAGADQLSDVLAYLALKTLNALLSKSQIPTSAMSLGTLGLKLVAGPTISGQPPAQLQIWEDLT